MVNVYHLKTILLFKMLFLTPKLILSNQKTKLQTPIKDLKSYTSSEIYAELAAKKWAETRVESVAMCDREKCPKLIDLCPKGGNCSVTGACEEEGCFCRIEIQCKGMDQRAIESGDDYSNFGEFLKDKKELSEIKTGQGKIGDNEFGSGQAGNPGADYAFSEDSHFTYDSNQENKSKENIGEDYASSEDSHETDEGSDEPQKYKGKSREKSKKGNTDSPKHYGADERGRDEKEENKEEKEGDSKEKNKGSIEKDEDQNEKDIEEEDGQKQDKTTEGEEGVGEKKLGKEKLMMMTTDDKETEKEEKNTDEAESEHFMMTTDDEETEKEEKNIDEPESENFMMTTDDEEKEKEDKNIDEAESENLSPKSEIGKDLGKEVDKSKINMEENSDVRGKTEDSTEEEDEQNKSHIEESNGDKKGNTSDEESGKEEDQTEKTENEDYQEKGKDETEKEMGEKEVQNKESKEDLKSEGEKNGEGVERENSEGGKEVEKYHGEEEDDEKKDVHSTEKEEEIHKDDDENENGDEKSTDVEINIDGDQTTKSEVEEKEEKKKNMEGKENKGKESMEDVEGSREKEEINSSDESHPNYGKGKHEIETSPGETEKELIKLLEDSGESSEGNLTNNVDYNEDKKNENNASSEEQKTADNNVTDTDILAKGEKIDEQIYENGTKFRYCFDDFEKCDEPFAIERCFKIRDDNGCSKQKKGCKFRVKKGRCCLVYQCQLENKEDKYGEDLENLFEYEAEEKVIMTENKEDKDPNIKNESTENIEDRNKNKKNESTENMEDENINDKSDSNENIEEKNKNDKTVSTENIEKENKNESTVNIEEENKNDKTESIEKKEEENNIKSTENIKEGNTNYKNEATEAKQDDHDIIEQDNKNSKEYSKSDIDSQEEKEANDSKEWLEEIEKAFEIDTEVDLKDLGQNEENITTSTLELESKENGLDEKENPEPACTEGVKGEKECKEKAQSWCKSQTCENGYVGRCQFKNKHGTCCKKYKCKKNKEMGEDMMEKLKSGETIVHYFYKGEQNITSILRPHHCNKTSICSALEYKGVCDDSNIACDTNFSCEENQCKCIVTTSCNGEPRKTLLKDKHFEEMSLYGATSLSFDHKDKSKCEKSICDSEISKESETICNQTSIGTCTTHLSCKEKCTCWINIECQKHGDEEVEKVEKVEYKKTDNAILLPPLMYTEKLTLYIGRDPAKNYSDDTWRLDAKDKCERQVGRFDLGCSVARTSSSHVFCMEGYCVCYVQYSKCAGMVAWDKEKSFKDSNEDSTSKEEKSKEPAGKDYADNESNETNNESYDNVSESVESDSEIDLKSGESNQESDSEISEETEEGQDYADSENDLSDSEYDWGSWETGEDKEKVTGHDYNDDVENDEGNSENDESDSETDSGSGSREGRQESGSKIPEQTNEGSTIKIVRESKEHDIPSREVDINKLGIDYEDKSDKPETRRGIFNSLLHELTLTTLEAFGADYMDSGGVEEGGTRIAENNEIFGENNFGIGENVNDQTRTRKTFYQAHIFPLHMLEKLKGGGETSTYMISDKCTDDAMCPRVEFFCGDSGGECRAIPNCNDKNDDGCLCTLDVKCAEKNAL